MTATSGNRSIRVPTHLPTVFAATALTHLIPDATGLLGLWGTLLKTLPNVLPALILR